MRATFVPEVVGMRVEITDVLGRLQAGFTPAQLDAELKTLKERLNPEYPAYKREWGVEVVSLREALLADNENDLAFHIVTLRDQPGGPGMPNQPSSRPTTNTLTGSPDCTNTLAKKDKKTEGPHPFWEGLTM